MFFKRRGQGKKAEKSTKLDGIVIDQKHNQSHEQTPVEAVSAEDERFVYFMYACAKNDRWNEAEGIYKEFPDMISIPLTSGQDTALHVAASAKNSNTFAPGLVNLMKPEELAIQNSEGRTPFCIAAISGRRRLLTVMSTKNKDLPLIRGHDGMLPVHLATLIGHHGIVQDLSSDDHLERMDPNDIKRLFFMTIRSNMYGVAIKLLEKYRATLATSRDEDQLTAFHVLAGKPSKELIMKGKEEEKASPGGHTFLMKLWSHVKPLEYKEKLELITTPSPVLFDAIESGNDNFVKLLLWCNPAFLTQKYSEGRTLLHLAALYRRGDIFKYILTTGTVDLITRALDNDHNNVLHFAAQQPPEERRLSLIKPDIQKETEQDRSKPEEERYEQFSLIKVRPQRPDIQMRSELEWFQEVEKLVPEELKTMKNRKGMTANEIFYFSHKKLSEQIRDSAKEIVNSGMLVATLVATVVFAAALVVPGDDKTSTWFIVFIMSNAVAIFTSSASIISFLSTFTSSRFIGSKFITALPIGLIMGLTLLLYAIAGMVVAFVAACFLIFDHSSKWVAYVVAGMGSFPILLLLWPPVSPFALSQGLINQFFRSILDAIICHSNSNKNRML